MTIGRLNRETNPVPGEKSGYTPQHALSDGSFVNTGETNPLPTREYSIIIKEVWQGSSSVTKNFGTNMYGFSIINDGGSDITVDILTHSIVVKPGESFEGSFDAFTTLDITATSSYRAVVRGE